MATESSAIARLVELAQSQPIADRPREREPTLIVRLVEPHRWLRYCLPVGLVAALAFAATAWLPGLDAWTTAQPIHPRGPTPIPVAEPLPAAEPLVQPLSPEPEPEPAAAPADSASEERVDEHSHRSRSAAHTHARRKRQTQTSGIGTLQIGSKPPCDIFIDGRDTKLKTPQRSIRLRPGRHRIGLTNRDHDIDERFVVKIHDGQTTRVIRDMTDRL